MRLGVQFKVCIMQHTHHTPVFFPQRIQLLRKITQDPAYGICVADMKYFLIVFAENITGLFYGSHNYHPLFL
jgi:hypothetical protein